MEKLVHKDNKLKTENIFKAFAEITGYYFLVEIQNTSRGLH
jgi:hypothetical protein